MAELLLDGALLATRADLHDALSGGLGLPPWYGRNLDALYDCLTDLREETVIRLVRPGALEDHLGGYARSLTAVLRSAAAENPRLRFSAAEEPDA